MKKKNRREKRLESDASFDYSVASAQECTERNASEPISHAEAQNYDDIVKLPTEPGFSSLGL